MRSNSIEIFHIQKITCQQIIGNRYCPSEHVYFNRIVHQGNFSVKKNSWGNQHILGMNGQHDTQLPTKLVVSRVGYDGVFILLFPVKRVFLFLAKDVFLVLKEIEIFRLVLSMKELSGQTFAERLLYSILCSLSSPLSPLDTNM